MKFGLFNLILLLLLAGFSPLAAANECSRVNDDIAVFDATVDAKRSKFSETPADSSDIEWVKSKIFHMVDIDQYLRTTIIELPRKQQYSQAELSCFWKEMSPRWQAIDSTNTNDLNFLMKIYGWFRISNFGKETSQNAWLLAQHADLNRDFQREVLALLEKLYPVGEVAPRNYAYLYDRVTWYGDGKPQRYATQGQCQGPGNWQPHPTEDLQNVDGRRTSMGIEPLAENKLRLDKNCY